MVDGSGRIKSRGNVKRGRQKLSNDTPRVWRVSQDSLDALDGINIDEMFILPTSDLLVKYSSCMHLDCHSLYTPTNIRLSRTAYNPEVC